LDCPYRATGVCLQIFCAVWKYTPTLIYIRRQLETEKYATTGSLQGY
jgi:hypothetical protein